MHISVDYMGPQFFYLCNFFYLEVKAAVTLKYIFLWWTSSSYLEFLLYVLLTICSSTSVMFRLFYSREDVTPDSKLFYLEVLSMRDDTDLAQVFILI